MPRKALAANQRNLIGPKLKEVRLARGLSQEKVVALLEDEQGLKIDRTALTRLENRNRNIDDIEIVALAKIYGVAPGSFFEE